MSKRLRPFRQSPELRFYLTLAFLIWSLIPHYQIIIHAHGGPADGHAHATLSSEGIELADQALQGLPSALPLEFGGEMAASPAATADGTSWASGAGFDHAHFQQDLNSVSVLLRLQASIGPPLREAAEPLLYRSPAHAVPALRLARGPPASFPV